jgi:DNA primase
MEVLINSSWYIRRKEEGMAIRGSNTRETNSPQYSAAQTKSIAKGIGLHVVGETNSEISFYCPFHSNTHSPSCSINKESGAWICFNPSCGESGTLLELVKRVMQKNDFEAIRFIASKEAEALDGFDEFLNNLLEDKPEFEEFPQTTLDNLYNELGSSAAAKEYFKSRGITEESMHHFKLGYSSQQNMVIVPVHSPDGLPVGLVGRSISEKKFKNSTNLPRSKTMFNIHRAKRIGDHVIIVESSFDAIRVHQAGFPNVVATLGGHISPDNIKLLNRYFNTITLMTDADVAGRDLSLNISNKLRMKNILWASYSYGKIYPHNAKDAGDMTEEEIKDCIKNSVSDIEYRSWNK